MILFYFVIKIHMRVIITDIGAVHQWLNRPSREMQVAKLVDLENHTVICDCVPDRIKAILEDFNRLKDHKLFLQLFQKYLLRQPIRELDIVGDAYKKAVDRYQQYVDKLDSGKMFVSI